MKSPFSGVRAAVVGVGILVISLLHHAVPLSRLQWHNILQHLYYLPIVLAGLSFGWKGGLGAATLAGALHAPHIWVTWHAIPNYSKDQILEIFTFCLAGLLTGIAAERERKQREALERTTDQLGEVYRELQSNVEQMKRAERLFAVGQLSAGLAHEIRNPLASIAGAAGILRRQAASNQKQAECLDIINRECERLNRLLQQFLDFARPRTPRYQPIELPAVLDSVMNLAAHAVGNQPIVLRRDLPPGFPRFRCDAEQLTQVLVNLLINAIQASPDGGEILVSGRVEDRMVVIRVKDHGLGVKPEHLDRIFDPFFTTKENGTGLGLSVAHQIVSQLSGQLSASPNLDKGMTFRIELPLNRKAAP